MDNNRNFLLTIGLSIVILILWQVFYMNPRIEAQREAARIETERQASQQQSEQPAGADLPNAAIPAPAGSVDATIPGQTPAADKAAAKDNAPRIQIDTPSLVGSINLNGARIDDLSLKDYRVAVDPNSEIIRLLTQSGRPDAYFAETGFVGNDATGPVPGPNTVWSVTGNPVLTPTDPVVLQYDNGKGLTFERTVSVDDGYLFTISDRVNNATSTDINLAPYGRITRFQKPETQSIYVLHEGMIGVTGEESLQELDYSDVEDDKEIKPSKSEDGWLGITDKYWAAVLVPKSGQPFQPRYSYFSDGVPRYQVDFLSDPVSIKAGQSTTLDTLVFAGAKQVSKITEYETKNDVRQFELLIDWGWFYFITKPMFYVIDYLFKLFGNFGVAILATTVLVKLVFFPLANKSYVSMAKMKTVQPAMMEIRDKYADDRTKQQQAMMELYKKEKINPLAGCWPILIQIPVFFALYKVLYVTIEMRHAPFFGWIQDLAAPDPTSMFNLFGLLPYDVPQFLMIGVWPLIMGITMFLQMRMNPTPPDPTQAMIFTWMPVIFTFMLATFPAGLVIYWAWNNFLSILQQGVIMKRQGAKIELWDNLVALFKKKPDPAE